MEHFGDLRGILHYVPQFRGRVFVIAIDGAVVASENFANVLLDLAVLHSLNIKSVLVYGAGHQVAQLAESRGVDISDAEGIGVTDEVTLGLSIDAITTMGSGIMRDLTGIGLRCALANALLARAAGIVEGVDLGKTGKVESVAADTLRTFLDQGMIPLVAPLGYDGKGNTFRLNSDACAAEIAVALKAAKILFLSQDDIGTVPRQLPVEDAERVAEEEVGHSAGFRSKLRAGAVACRRGVARTQIIDGSVNEGLLRELFSNEGIATMVYVDTYQQFRRAGAADLPEIVSLIRQSVAKGELARRTRREVLDQIADYHLLEVDGNVVGTVAVHFYDPEGVAELACLFVKEAHGGKGYGKALADFAVNLARDLGATRIFALTTQATGFFDNRLGFVEGADEDLPEPRRLRRASSGRNSRIMVKEFASGE